MSTTRQHEIGGLQQARRALVFKVNHSPSHIPGSRQPLSQENLASQLRTTWLGRSCHVFSVLDSSNSWLKRLLDQGSPPPHGTLVVTDYQSAGRGRGQRQWTAPPGTSLMFSLYLDLGWPAEQANWLVMSTGLALVETMAAIPGLPVQLKWPNDLVVPDPVNAYRKLGGVLLETIWQGSRLHGVVLGVGINVHQSPDQLPQVTPPATSIQIESGQSLSRLSLLVELLARLEAEVDSANRGCSPLERWRRELVMLGQQVLVTTPQGILAGIARDVDDWGRLLLDDESGQTVKVAAGDVSLRWPTN